MKPYYKKNGFYDRLERFSEWFDGWFYYYISNVVFSLKFYGFMYYIPGFRRLSIKSAYIRENKQYIAYCEDSISELTEEYNREKYFWMAKK